jgi:hypothetical protein
MTQTPTLTQLLKHAIDNRLLDLHTALIAKVESYDAAKQQVNVSPILKRSLPTLDGELAEEQLPMICDVPVLFPRANGFFISFPIKPGDLVQVIFNEKIGIQGAVAIPGVYADSPLSDAHENNLVLGKDQGVQIHIDGNKIKLGSDKASEALAIASKVKAELDKIAAAFNAHTHTGACPTGTVTTTATLNQLDPPGVIGTTKVVAE